MGEADSLVTFAVSIWTLDILSSLESWILDAIFVHSVDDTATALSDIGMVTLVDTVVPLIIFSGLFEMTADSTVVDESRDTLVFVINLLFWIKHVITFLAEAHTFESCSRLLVILLDLR